MKVFCTEKQRPVEFEKVCINCTFYEECPDRPGAERALVLGVVYIFILTLIAIII